MSNDTTNYLEKYDAAAEADKFPMVRRWMDTEPLPFFKELREKRPILVTPGGTLLARFDDFTEVMDQPKIFTVQLYVPKMSNDYLMSHDDDAIHYREKSIMQGLLNRNDLPKVRALITKLANEILDNAKGKIEVVYGYCRSVPAGMVQDYFGFTGVDRKDLIEWSYWAQYDTFHNQPFDLISDEMRKHITKRHDETGALLGKYVTELIVRRLVPVKAEQAKHTVFALWYLLLKQIRKMQGKVEEALTDDMVTRLLSTSFPDEVEFDIKRLGTNACGLLIGSIETTSQCVAQVIQFLLDRPDLKEQAIKAAALDDPTAFDGIVWEALRYVPLSPYLFRQVASEYTVAKGTDRATTLKPGSYVLPLVQSAMFDERAFEKPDEFISTRNWYHYFHFGFGSHECLGKYVGMVMIPEMVRQVLLRPGIKAEGKIDYKSGPFPENYELSWGG